MYKSLSGSLTLKIDSERDTFLRMRNFRIFLLESIFADRWLCKSTNTPASEQGGDGDVIENLKMVQSYCYRGCIRFCLEVLLDEIINDGSTEKLPSYKIPPRTATEVFQKSEEVLPKPSPDIVAAVFQEKEQPEEMVQESSSRTEGDIIGFSDETSDSNESIDITDIKSKAKFLSAAVEKLIKRFHELYTEFTRQGKHEHKNQLVFLLDELLRQEELEKKKGRRKCWW